MKLYAAILSLPLVTLSQATLAEDSSFEILTTKSMATASVGKPGVERDIDSDVEGDLGAANTFATAYSVMGDLWEGFQCAYSSSWSKGPEGNKECSIYLTSNVVRFSGEEQGHLPYAVSMWEATFVVTELMYLRFDYFVNFLHGQASDRSGLTHTITADCVELVTGFENRVRRDINEDSNEGAGAVYPPGVYRMQLTLETYFTGHTYYQAFESIQGGMFIQISQVDYGPAPGEIEID